jgi:hypothetical protein
VEAADHAWEPGLVDDILAEVRDEPACLPLLQFAGTLLWERRDRARKLLTRDAYARTGGVGGALATHADGVLSGVPPEHVAVAREMLLRLVTPEETRQALPRSALVGEMPPERAKVADVVLDRLVEARLLSERRARTDEGKGEVELIHESLITRWATLARWLDESREERAVLAEARGGGALASTWRAHRRHLAGRSAPRRHPRAAAHRAPPRRRAALPRRGRAA